MHRVNAFIALALAVATASAAADQCCRRTYKVTQSAYEPVKILQRTVFLTVSHTDGVEGSAVGTKKTKDSISKLKKLLSSNSSNGITDIQEGALQVDINSNTQCDITGNNCQTIVTGYVSRIRLSFNAPIGTIDVLFPQIRRISGANIDYQNDYVPPDTFAAAQNAAIKRALSYAKYRAQQTVSGLEENVRLGKVVDAAVSSGDFIQNNGGINSAALGTVEVTYELY